MEELLEVLLTKREIAMICIAVFHFTGDSLVGSIASHVHKPLGILESAGVSEHPVHDDFHELRRKLQEILEV